MTFLEDCERQCLLRGIIFEGEGGYTQAVTSQLLTAEAAVFSAQEVDLMIL